MAVREGFERATGSGLKFVFAGAIIFYVLSAYGSDWQWEGESWKKTQDISNPFYQRFQNAMELFQEKTPKALAGAEKAFALLAKEEENPYRFESRLMQGTCLFERGEPEKSYKVLKNLLKDSPPPKVRQAALDLEVQIAEAYLSGMKKKVFGIRAFDSFGRAMRILTEVLEQEPTGKSAPGVQMRIADAYYSRGNYLEAGLAYNIFLKRFPDNPERGYCQLRLVLCRLKESRGAEYDPVPYEESRDMLKRLIKEEEDATLRKQAEGLLKEVRSALAQKDFSIAEYYLKSGKPQAATGYYKRVVKIYPDTAWGRKAEEQLAKMATESQGE